MSSFACCIPKPGKPVDGTDGNTWLRCFMKTKLLSVVDERATIRTAGFDGLLSFSEVSWPVFVKHSASNNQDNTSNS